MPSIKTQSKLWFQSKTILTNGLIIAGGLLTQFLGSVPADSKTAIWTGVGVAAINAALRVTTNQPVALQ
jgi:multidrug transporter EmrE-like cation transporter